MPVLSIGKTFRNNLKFDSELSFDSYLNYHFAGSVNDISDSKIKPYRLWVRLSTERFELRAGLQKINFGSASMLRPLMWFDHIDPRDPLQLTDGVYGLLGRYYFQNNANAWLWVLWGNDKTRAGKPSLPKEKFQNMEEECNFRFQKENWLFHIIIVPQIWQGYLNRHLIHGSSTYREDRIGLDGKWDIGPDYGLNIHSP